MRTIRIAVAAALFLAAASAQAGIVVTYDNGEVTVFSAGKMKGSDESGTVIMDGKTGQLTFIMDQKKAYARGTVEEYCKMVTSIRDKMMEALTEEQRKMMEQMLGAMKPKEPPKVSVEKVGPGEAVAGFKTVKYKVTVNGKLYEELWLATDEALIKEYTPLLTSFAKFSACGGGMDMRDAVEASDEYLGLLERGFVMKSVSYEGAAPEVDELVVKLEKKDIPASEFEPPSGYREFSIDELLVQMGMGE
jgi:hypothetical protein